MAKMTIIDDDGKTDTFNHFIAVGYNEKEQVSRMIEDEGLTPQDQLVFILEGIKLLCEIAQAIQPDKQEV